MTIIWTVAIDFAHDGFGPDDDVTPWFLRAAIALGIREPETLTAAPGRCTLTLNNADGRFSPARADGPYAGRLRPNLPVRVRATPDGGDAVTVFRGVTRRWEPAPGAFGARTCAVECADVLDALARAPLALPLREGERGDQLVRHVLNIALNAPAASGHIAFNANAADGDTAAINGVTYTFRTALQPDTPGQVRIGATAALTVEALAAAINGEAGAGTLYTLSTPRPEGVQAAPNPTYARRVIGDGAIRYYRLGESGGSAALDSGLNGRDGVYVGATPGDPGALSGDPDGAARFDGIDDYVALPTLALDHRSFTLEAWVHPDADPPAYQAIFGGFAAWGLHTWFDLLISAAGGLIWRLGGDDLWTDGGLIAFDAWNHVALTYDAAADVTRLYLNGARIATGDHGPFEGINPALRIGSMGHGVAVPFKGAIDEAAIYLRALPEAAIAAHAAAEGVTRGVTLTAILPGSAGNAIPLAVSGAGLAVSGPALSGGDDWPIDPAPALETGSQVFEVAGDRWSSDRTDALAALREITAGERGLCWAARDGSLRWGNAYYPFRRAGAAPSLTVAGEMRATGGLAEASIANAVRVSFTPRATVSAGEPGIVAQSHATLAIPGQSGLAAYDPLRPLAFPGGGERLIALRFVDTATGQPAGARDLVLPLVPDVDWAANDRPDGAGFDYTGSPSLAFQVTATATGVHISVRNTALGPLYLTMLRVRGRLITAYDPVTIAREDAESQALYGVRALTVALPLPTGQGFAESLAAYLLARRSAPAYALTRLETQLPAIGGAPVIGIEIGDVIAVSDAHTASAEARYLVTGVAYAVGPGGLESTAFDVRRLDDQTYALYDDEGLGRYESEAARYAI